jgi:hypothetical protein
MNGVRTIARGARVLDQEAVYVEAVYRLPAVEPEGTAERRVSPELPEANGSDGGPGLEPSE